jgi:PAS domain S-box-containing protein
MINKDMALSEKDRQAHTRNRCNGEGYESVALVPIRSVEGCLGLLQFNDRQKGRFTKERIELFERLANNLAITISQRKSEKSYQDMFNGMINGFALHEIICDESGKPINYRFIDVNSAFEKLTGLSRDLVVGNTVLDVMTETEPYWIDIYGKVALTGEPTQFENYSNGLGKHFEVTAYSPQKGQFATIFNDITDRKQAEVLQEKLQQASKMESIGRLAGGVAHDFNNLLTVIQGSASLGLSDLSKNDPIYDRLKMILEASERAADLTRQLLAFSRRQIIEMKVINANNLISICL